MNLKSTSGKVGLEKFINVVVFLEEPHLLDFFLENTHSHDLVLGRAPVLSE